MKTYEETAQYILEVRNEHDKKIKRRKALAMRIIPAAVGICGAVVICFAAVKNYRKPIDMITDESVITGGSISIVTTVPYGTEEAVTTLISSEKTTAKTIAEMLKILLLIILKSVKISVFLCYLRDNLNVIIL